MSSFAKWFLMGLTLCALSLPAAAQRLAVFQLDSASQAEPEEETVTEAEDPNASGFDVYSRQQAHMPKEKTAPKVVMVKQPAKPAEPTPRDIPLIETKNESHAADDVSYITGGIGDEEKSLIEAAKDDYNLQILNTDRTGSYTGDVRVVIEAVENGSIKEKLNVFAGPLLYVRLPASNQVRYTIKAALGAQQQAKTVMLPGGKGKAAKLTFVWKTRGAPE